MDEHKIRNDLQKAGAAQIRSDLAKGAYHRDASLRKIVTDWLSEQELPVRESREAESLAASQEANFLAKDSNRIALEANRFAEAAEKRAERADSIARAAIMIALATLIIQAWPYIKSII